MTSTQGRRPTGAGWHWYTGEYPGVWEPNHYDGPVEAVDNGDAWLIGECQTYLTDSLPGDFIPLTKPVAAPEPDWSSAPPGANWWAVDPDGSCHWFDNKPILDQVGVPGEMGPHWSWAGSYFERWETVDLPIGCDWRTTLRKRPEVQSE